MRPIANRIVLASLPLLLLATAAMPARADDATPVGRWALEDNGSIVTVTRPAGAAGATATPLHYSGVIEDGAPRELTETPPTPPADADPAAPLPAPTSWVFPLASDPSARSVGLVEVIGTLRVSTTKEAASGDEIVLTLPKKDQLQVVHRHAGKTVATLHLDRQPDANPKVTLFIYPGESQRGDNVYGHVYVVGGKGESYEIAAGPPPGQGGADAGGHTVGATPAGRYVLGEKEHHYTKSWPDSTIPWGATLEKRADGFVYYSIHEGAWVQVSGPDGVVTKANGAFWDHSSTGDHIDQGPREDFANDMSDLYDDKGQLISPWTQGDFGEWAWNLTRGGKRTVFYLHTTPDDEQAFRAGTTRDMDNSHGCVHIAPASRDDMIAKGYLQKGVAVIVKAYGEKGPPPAN